MTAIVSVDFDWSIESCDKAPRDLDYELNTEKYGGAMKLTIPVLYCMFIKTNYIVRKTNSLSIRGLVKSIILLLSLIYDSTGLVLNLLNMFSVVL